MLNLKLPELFLKTEPESPCNFLDIVQLQACHRERCEVESPKDFSGIISPSIAESLKEAAKAQQFLQGPVSPALTSASDSSDDSRLSRSLQNGRFRDTFEVEGFEGRGAYGAVLRARALEKSLGGVEGELDEASKESWRRSASKESCGSQTSSKPALDESFGSEAFVSDPFGFQEQRGGPEVNIKPGATYAVKLIPALLREDVDALARSPVWGGMELFAKLQAMPGAVRYVSVWAEERQFLPEDALSYLGPVVDEKSRCPTKSEGIAWTANNSNSDSSVSTASAPPDGFEWAKKERVGGQRKSKEEKGDWGGSQATTCEPVRAAKRRVVLVIVMEMCEGRLLKHWIADFNGNVPKDKAINVALALATAVRDLHDQGIVHRDLKPDNVFVCAGETAVQIIDFDLATIPTRNTIGSLHESRMLKTSFNAHIEIGTPGYASPIARSKRSLVEHQHLRNIASLDLFPVAVLLLEMCMSYATHMERIKTVDHFRATGFVSRAVRKECPEVVSILRALGSKSQEASHRYGMSAKPLVEALMRIKLSGPLEVIPE